MVQAAGGFSLLLHSLGLRQGLYKPEPSSYASHAPAVQSKVAVPESISAGGPQPNANLGNNYQVQAVGDYAGTGSQLSSASGDCSVQPYNAPDMSGLAFPPFDPAKANVYRYRQQQSVNLGSWFVHEQWMTPSVFECASGSQISELDIASGWGSPESARAVLERHWDTFVTASDFQYLAGIGINTVRIPIGYWTLGPAFCQGTPFEPVADVYQNAWSRVVNAINMASDAGIGVLVDLHGAPGSQNGQPHSGISDGNVGLFGNEWYINKTINVLTSLTQQLENVTNVVGIQILNEPQNADSLPDFYSQAICAMRQVSPTAQSFPLYIHDGFNLDQYSEFVANRSDFVVQDHHSYFVFTSSDAAEPASQHTKDVQSSVMDSLAAASDRQRRNLVVDEFSCALTAQSLAEEEDPDGARRAFCEGQMELYQNETAGWAFWAYNKEDCENDEGWCFKAAVGKSLPSSFFSYGAGPVADPSRLPALADMVADMYAPSHEDIAAALQPGRPTPEVGVFQVNRRSRHRTRRGARPAPQPESPFQRRDDAEQLPLDPSQRSVSKGYSDGFLTAKIFALYGLSKLGFTGQYVDDSIAKLGHEVIAPGTEHYYRQWFMEGLADGEALIASSINPASM